MSVVLLFYPITIYTVNIKDRVIWIPFTQYCSAFAPSPACCSLPVVAEKSFINGAQKKLHEWLNKSERDTPDQ
ncbi:hypothetical protein QTO39_24920 [Escherichia coli]|nr:hypothetical protein [Escherichia coli]MCX8432415.1 hypothetical protein [Escherichia coli]MDM4048695.1 hypothetical protein [Escherichia coli]